MVVIGGSFCRNDALKEEVLQRSRFPVILFIYLFFFWQDFGFIFCGFKPVNYESFGWILVSR